MFVLVCYDIADDQRRHKVFKIMKNYGFRVQYSVFECLLSADQIQELRCRMGTLIDGRQDSVRYYRLCEPCQKGAVVQGIGTILEDRTTIFV